MPRAKLYLDGDNKYTQKVKRIHKLTQEVEEAIDGIPGIVNTLDSISETDALSAAQGKYLQDQINELKSMGRFLSTWDCETGLPTTDPIDDPYDYRIGDYYIVSRVSSNTNYRPHGDRYVAGQASVTIETAIVNVNDWYLYDGTNWILQNQNQITITVDTTLSTTSQNAVENRVITQALNTKQNTISDLATIRNNASLATTAVQPGDSLSVLDNTATGYQTAGDVANAISGKANASDLTALTGRVTTAEGTIASQGQAITALQQSGGSTAGDVTSLQSDVADIQDDITAINTALNGKVNASSLATVATSGLSSDLNNDAGFITAAYVGNGQVSITQGGVTKGSFLLNQSGPSTIPLDAGFTPSNNGTTGQTLVKTANGYQWATPETGGNVIAMTQAEYNLLSSEEKTDGKLRIISDAPTIDVISTVDSSPIKASNIWVGAQSEYDALTGYDEGVIYIAI